MTVSELIEALNELIADGEITGESQLVFAHQPHYPLQCGVGGPVVIDEDEAADIESHLEDASYWDTTEEMADAHRRLYTLRKNRRPPIVYLHETRLPDGEMSPYAPPEAFGD